MAIKVKLRQKVISGDRHSFYLDFYPPIPHPETSKLTRREFLGFYLFDKPKTPSDKQHNKDTRQLAEQIRQKRDNQLNKPEIYTGYEKEQLKIRERGQRSFTEYFKQLAEKRKGSNHDNWISAYQHFDKFISGNVSFGDLDEKFCNDFRDYLLNATSNRSSKVKISVNTAVSYFNKLKATLKQAYKDGVMQTDINPRIERIKEAETHRNFLTIEELNTLVKTECPNLLVKKAALFSALTGLRFSDIAKLKWGELEFIKGQGYFIHFTQQKTQMVEDLPISEQAYSLLGERKLKKDQVFVGLEYSSVSNALLKWLNEAKISKKITFHCFRHTFATLQLLNGTDIYTVSKMLGHRDLKTTQVYAKVVDQTKRKASDNIKLTF